MQKITRRRFLRHVALAGGIGAFSFANGRYKITLGQEPVAYKLRVLHTNDHHGRIEPVSIAIRNTPEPAITREFGGVARRKALIDHVLATAAPDENVVLLDAGDVFQGTLYFTQYSGQADMHFYNGMNYHAVAVGNHEFDNGQASLRDFVLNANFPMLSANLNVEPSAVLAAAVAPTDIATPGRLGKRVIIAKGGKKIGLFGLTPPTTSILSNVGAGVTFGSNLATVAQAQVDALEAEGANYIIGLTHIGYAADTQLAAQVRGIDLIVGGHSHSVILPVPTSAPLGVEAQGPYPTVVVNPDGENVIVTTDWKWGTWLGDITLGFNAEGVVAVISGVIRPIWADGLGNPPRPLLPGEGDALAPDASFQIQIDTVYKPPITALQNIVVGRSATQLNGDRVDVRNRETNLGNLIADLMLRKVQPDGGQIAILNAGSIGKSISVGDVTLARVIEVLPFDSTIARVDLTGAQILQALENAVSQVSLLNPNNSAGRFVQVSGLSFTWTPSAPVGSRILSAKAHYSSTSGAGPRTQSALIPIDPAAIHRVVTNNFMLVGGDGFAVFTAGMNQYDTGFTLTDTLSDHFRINSPVSAYVEGRITLASRTYTPLIPKASLVPNLASGPAIVV